VNEDRPIISAASR